MLWGAGAAMLGAFLALIAFQDWVVAGAVLGGLVVVFLVMRR
jgi:hypothetical protein